MMCYLEYLYEMQYSS